MTDQLSRELLGLLRRQSMKRIHSNESSLVQGQVQWSWSNAVRLSRLETKPIQSNPYRRRYKILIFIENCKIQGADDKLGQTFNNYEKRHNFYENECIDLKFCTRVTYLAGPHPTSLNKSVLSLRQKLDSTV